MASHRDALALRLSSGALPTYQHRYIAPRGGDHVLCRASSIASAPPSALATIAVAPRRPRFLTSLAVDGKVAASTQNQALNALLFLYREVLELDLPWLDGIVRPQRLPVVLTRDEVRAVLERIEAVPRLMAYLLYGAGLRLLECCRLRVQDVDFTSNQIVVRGG